MSVRESSHVIVVDLTPSRRFSFEDLQVGDTVSQEVTFTNELKEAFKQLSCDSALIHSSTEFASVMGFPEPIIQGLCITSRFSRLIGMYLPGEGSIVESLDFKFRNPIYFGHSVNFHLEIIRTLSALKVIRLRLVAKSDGLICVEGGAQCILLPCK
jgi:acyl dehydratase